MKKNRESKLQLVRELLSSIWGLVPTYFFFNVILGLSFIASILIVVFFFIIQIVYGMLAWNNKVFYVKDDIFYIQFGVFRKTSLEVPLEKIMGISIKEEIVEKIFFLRTLIIDRGLDIDEKLSLTLKKEEAFEFRKLLLKDNVLTEETQEIKTEMLYELSHKDLIIFSLSKISWFQLGAFIVSAVFFINEYDLTSAISVEFKQDLYTVLLVVLVLFLLNGIINFIKYYGFTVEKKENVIEMSTGLIIKKVTSINLMHINSVKTDQTIIQRIIKSKTVMISTLGYNDDLGESAVVFPMIQDKELNVLWERLFLKFMYQGEVKKIHPAYLIRYRTTTYGYDDTLIFLSNGVFNKRVSIILKDEVDCIKSIQYPWQSLINVCQVKVCYKSMKLSDLKRLTGVSIENYKEMVDGVVGKK